MRNLKEFSVKYLNKYGETVHRICYTENAEQAKVAWKDSQYSEGAKFVGVELAKPEINIDDLILETTLNLLSVMESKNIEPRVTLDKVESSIPYNQKARCNKQYIQMILDDEFSKKYDGKEIVYFLKVKS
jgi:hypothetical protein